MIVESLVNQFVNEVGRPFSVSMQSDRVKDISIQSPLQLGGSQGRKSTLGVLGWSTGGVIFIGKLIQGLDFSRIMCSSMMEQIP